MLPIYEIRKSDLSVKHNKYELNYPEHMHKYIEIVYVYRGIQHLKINDKDYTITEGSLAVVLPDTIHSFYSCEDDGDDIDVLILICAPEIFGKLLPDLKDTSTDNAVINKDDICDELRFALRAVRPDQSFEIKFSWACVVMSYILEQIKLNQHKHSPVSDITYKLIKYIGENFTEEITRKSLANHFHVSESYISIIFTNKFKMSLRKYLGLLRAEYAASLIRTTNENFTVICQHSGFDSSRTFNRIFKAAYGQTPREYRNNINKFINE